MAYHHFASVKDVTRELVACLKPRSTLAVADILRVEADEGEWPSTSIWSRTRVDFPKTKYAGCLEGAGLENVAFEHFASGKKEGRDVQFFLATHQARFRTVKNPFVVELVNSFGYEYNNTSCMEYE